MSQLPSALVLSLSSSGSQLRVCVSCPYCLYNHSHHVCSLHPGQIRAADCLHLSKGRSYELNFPFGHTNASFKYGWELGKSKATIFTLTRNGRCLSEVPTRQEPQALESNELDQMTSAANALSIEEQDDSADDNEDKEQQECDAPESIWKSFMQSQKFRMKVWFSAIALQEIREIRRLLQEYPNDGFLTAKDVNLDNCITLAAAGERGLAVIELLHPLGADIAHANDKGRTPLMEAALWGRLDTVEYLLDKEVNTRARDRDGRTALVLADTSQHNNDERFWRCRGVRGGYREPMDAGYKRRSIEARIRQTQSGPTSNDDSKVFRPIFGPWKPKVIFERQQMGTVVAYEPARLFVDPSKSLTETFAALHRGSQYPTIYAMSGHNTRFQPDLLDNALWTEKVEKLCEVVGHTCMKEKQDACHAEKQLVAFLLDRHHIFEGSASDIELNDDEQPMAATVKQLDGGLPTQYEKILKVNKEAANNVDEILSLKRVIPVVPRGSRIEVNKTFMCTDCQNFMGKVRQHVGDLFSIDFVGER